MSRGGRTSRASAVAFFGALLIALLLVAGGGVSAPAVEAGGTTWYVKKGATGANNGTSWDDAFVSLQSALAVAVSGNAIFVAAGSYLPSVPAGRNATFAIPDGVKLYGSFTGNEQSLNQRVVPTTPSSILSGNLGPSRGSSDNAYHVVTAHNQASLDGFTITSGNANGASAPNDRGANLLVSGDIGRFTKLVLTHGHSTWDGGGAYVDGVQNQFSEVLFSFNTSGRNGGGLAIYGSLNSVMYATFLENEAGDGGGLFFSDTIGSNLTFVGNTAGRGGAVGNYAGTQSLRNVTIFDNTATSSGQGPLYASTGGDTAVTNAILWGNHGDELVGPSGGAAVEITGAIVEGGCPVQSGLTCSAVVNADPQLDATAQNHGGFVPTLAIPQESPAVDAAPAAGCASNDARGVERPFDVGGDGGNTCDFGAYEFVPLPALDIELEAGDINEGDTAHEFFVKPSHAYPETITATLTFTDGTAKAGKDYTATPGLISIEPFASLYVSGFTLVDDALDEPAEKFEITLSNLTNATPGPAASVEVPIQDNDSPPSIVFTQPSSSAPEATTPAKIAVSLSAPSGQDIQIGYTVTGGSAVAGEDYQAVTQPITIPAGSTSGVLRLKVVNDFVPEVDDEVLVTFAKAMNVTVGAASKYTYTIKNDDKVRFCQGKKVTIYGTPGNDRLGGTPKLDVIDAMSGDDFVRSRGGNDIVCGGAGKDVLRGGPGNDTLNGGGGGDTLLGGGGDDTLLGKGGADTLRGELGRDRLAGGSGKPDVCDGGPSTDTLLPAHGCESTAGVP